MKNKTVIVKFFVRLEIKQFEFKYINVHLWKALFGLGRIEIINGLIILVHSIHAQKMRVCFCV